MLYLHVIFDDNTHYVLLLFQRCYAAVGDVSKARYLKDVNQLANKITSETVRNTVHVHQIIRMYNVL